MRANGPTLRRGDGAGGNWWATKSHPELVRGPIPRPEVGCLQSSSGTVSRTRKPSRLGGRHPAGPRCPVSRRSPPERARTKAIPGSGRAIFRPLRVPRAAGADPGPLRRDVSPEHAHASRERRVVSLERDDGAPLRRRVWAEARGASTERRVAAPRRGPDERQRGDARPERLDHARRRHHVRPEEGACFGEAACCCAGTSRRCGQTGRRFVGAAMRSGGARR